VPSDGEPRKLRQAEPFYKTGSRRVAVGNFSARTALPYPLWAVHFSDRLVFSPVGFFWDRCFLGPLPQLQSRISVL